MTAVKPTSTTISTHSALIVRSSPCTAPESPASKRGPKRQRFCAASAINAANPTDLPITIAPYGVAIKGHAAYVSTGAVAPGVGNVIKVPLG